MNCGYVINDGLMHISDEDTLIAWMESQGLNPDAEFETVDTNDEWFYWTEWETPSEDDEHYLSDGTYKEAVHRWTEKIDLRRMIGYAVVDSEQGVEVEFTVGIRNKDYGWFEIYDIDSRGEDWYAEGGLRFEGNTLIGYDGIGVLPNQIINKLNELGFDTSLI